MINSSIIQIRALLNSLTGPAAKDEKARKDQDRKRSPRFAALYLFKSSEVIESRICAFLLNPREGHGQGALFLNAFLTQVQYPSSEASSVRVGVLTEAPCYSLPVRKTKRQRRIDILLEFPNGDVLAIENKGKGAEDGERQIDDYLQHLKAAYRGRRRLLYLSREGTVPSTKSYSSESEELEVKDFYETIDTWLNDCDKLCASLKVKNFLSDVRCFMGVQKKLKLNIQTSEVNSEIERIMLGDSTQDSAPLDALLAIYDARETVWKTAFRIFSRRLQQRLKEHHPQWSIAEGGFLTEGHWESIQFSDPLKNAAGEGPYIVEVIIQSQHGKTGDLGGKKGVVLQLPTNLMIGVYRGPEQTVIRKHREIWQIAELRSRVGVEYMLSDASVDEIANEIEVELVCAKEMSI